MIKVSLQRLTFFITRYKNFTVEVLDIYRGDAIINR